jgi:hypothetical protein
MLECEFCTLSVSKSNYSKHKKTDVCKNINNIIEKYKNENILKIKELNEEIERHKKDKDTLNNKIIFLETQLKEVNEKSDEYRKIVEKAATKTTVKNYTHNNYLNYISTEPIKFSELPKQLKEVVNCETVMYDESDFHDHIVENILKDENGKDKLLCTDINRKNFSYKDETSGELISDPELERLREQLKKGADIKSVRREVLNKLVDKYEGTQTDPYMKLYETVKKLEFGNPFVEHVAKKTYVKTKSTDIN